MRQNTFGGLLGFGAGGGSSVGRASERERSSDAKAANLRCKCSSAERAESRTTKREDVPVAGIVLVPGPPT